MTERTVKWALLGSLLFNALLIGLFAGQFLRHMPPMMAMRHMPKEMKEGRPDEAVRKTLDAAFDAEKPAMTEALKAMMDSRAKTVDMIRAEKIDPDALDGEFLAMRAANDKAMISFQRAIKAAALKLEPEQRAALSKMLDREPPGRKGRMGALGPPMGPPGGMPFMRDERRDGPPPLPPEMPDAPSPQ